MNDQKLIMENWRKFLKENQAQPLEEDLLEEGILDALAGMMFVLNIGGQEVQVPTQDLVDAYKTASSQQMDAEKVELGELIKDMSHLVKTGAVEPVDSDGDGVMELNPLISSGGNVSPEVGKLIKAELEDNADATVPVEDPVKAANQKMQSQWDSDQVQKQVDMMKKIQSQK